MIKELISKFKFVRKEYITRLFVEYITRLFVEYITRLFVEYITRLFVEYITRLFVEYITRLLCNISRTCLWNISRLFVEYITRLFVLSKRATVFKTNCVEIQTLKYFQIYTCLGSVKEPLALIYYYYYYYYTCLDHKFFTLFDHQIPKTFQTLV